MSADAKQRASDKIVRLAWRHLDLVSFWRESAEAIASAVPYYWTPCWYTLDPASLLITSHFNEDISEIPGEWLAQEYYEDDVNTLAGVARSARGISTLHEATGGDPASSPRWHANITLGGDQELIAALRTQAGDVWGALGLYRAPGQALFDAKELAFIQTVAPYLAEGARRALVAGEAIDPEGQEAPGLIVLSGNWEVESTTPGVEHWLAELPDGDWNAGRLPSSVLAVAGRALGPPSTRTSPARLRCRVYCPAQALGSCSTAPRSSRAACGASPSSSTSPPRPHRAAAHVGVRADRA